MNGNKNNSYVAVLRLRGGGCWSGFAHPGQHFSDCLAGQESLRKNAGLVDKTRHNQSATALELVECVHYHLLRWLRPSWKPVPSLTRSDIHKIGSCAAGAERYHSHSVRVQLFTKPHRKTVHKGLCGCIRCGVRDRLKTCH